jgi:hypothetical protein
MSWHGAHVHYASYPVCLKQADEFLESACGMADGHLNFRNCSPSLPQESLLQFSRGISLIEICRADRRNVVFRLLPDDFLCQIHEHLGFLITDSIDLAQ